MEYIFLSCVWNTLLLCRHLFTRIVTLFPLRNNLENILKLFISMDLHGKEAPARTRRPKKTNHPSPPSRINAGSQEKNKIDINNKTSHLPPNEWIFTCNLFAGKGEREGMKKQPSKIITIHTKKKLICYFGLQLFPSQSSSPSLDGRIDSVRSKSKRYFRLTFASVAINVASWHRVVGREGGLPLTSTLSRFLGEASTFISLFCY